MSPIFIQCKSARTVKLVCKWCVFPDVAYLLNFIESWICSPMMKPKFVLFFRLLWLLLIAIAIALSIYFIMQMWYKYDENPFIVSLATRPQAIFSVPFPAITICPVAKTDRDFFNYTDVAHRLWDGKEISPYEEETAQYLSSICDSDDINSYLSQNTSFTEEIFNRLDELDTTELFFNGTSMCQFMGENVNCDYILVPTVTDQGICYTFNMLSREEIFRPKVSQYKNYNQHENRSQWTNDNGYEKGAKKDVYPRRALQSGADSSLLIILPQLVKDTDYLCTIEDGYRITIHPPNTIPMTSKDFYVMPHDTACTVVLQPNLMTTSETVKSYKTADRQCYFSDERYLEYFVAYTQENCYLECLTNYTLKKCGCVEFYMPRENTTKICGNAMNTCTEEAESEMKLLELNFELEKDKALNYDSCNCLPLCTQLSYNTESSRYKWQWKKYFLAQKKIGISVQEANSMHFSMLNVFFKSDQFIPSEKTELYGPFDFLSNFGGLLGLFTGFSLLSAVELIYYMSVRLWCNKKLYNDLSGPPEEEEERSV